jgi:DNA-binding protein H-NS
MAKTLAQIQKQIENLQRQAEQIRSREVGEVVARIREAIAHYGLTTEEVFGSAAPGKKTRGRRKGSGSSTAGATGSASGAARKSTRAGRKSAAKPMYRDENGNTWSGRGRPPRWITSAIAEGKSKESFLIQPSA